MADNVAITPGTGATVAADDIGGVLHQRVKISIGADGAAADLAPGQATMANSLPVAIASNQGNVPVNQASQAYDVAVTITRPANTTPYGAGDVVGGAISIPLIGPSAGAIMITSAQLEADIAAIPSGMTNMLLYLYSVTPPSALADNAVFDLPSGDRASFLGVIDLSFLVDLGSTLYRETNGIGKQVKLAGTGLFGYLVTVGAFTPAANSEVYTLTLHSVAV